MECQTPSFSLAFHLIKNLTTVVAYGKLKSMKGDKAVTIRVKVKTRERLDKQKHKGQTYDGIINEILDKLEGGVKCQ